MKVGGKPYRSIWRGSDGRSVEVIDQTKLPHAFAVRRLISAPEAAEAIRAMVVRGAPLIGATAAYGMALAADRDASDAGLRRTGDFLVATRPTAVNLRWGVERMLKQLLARPVSARSRCPTCPG